MRIATGGRLIDAAETLLDAGGEAAVTLRAVAQAVGVSHNAPYRHFADRAALLAAVAERDFRAFIQTFATIDAGGGVPIAKVHAALEAFIAYGEAHPARYRLLFGDPVVAAAGGTLEEAAMGAFAALGRLVAQAQAAGALPNVPTSTLTGLMYAAVHGLLDLRAGGRMRAEKGFLGVSDGTLLLLDLIASPDGAGTPGEPLTD